jgi:hypothetical protein
MITSKVNASTHLHPKGMHRLKPETYTDGLEDLKQQLAKAEDLCAECAAQMFRKSLQAFRQAQLLSREL